MLNFSRLPFIGAALLCCLLPALAQEPQSHPAPATDPFTAQLIPRNSKVYIAPFKSENTQKPVEGFESYIAAAFQKKDVPLLIVNDRALADFEITGTADKKGAGTAKKILLGDFHSTTSASITVTNIRTGVVAWADSSHRESAARGLRSSAEKLAKYLKRKIEDDEKKLGHRH
jgi:CubicO group peptidase (beta-lactamase class C family)